VNVQLPEKLRVLFEPHRYKVLYGGRGGAKSWGVARVLLLLAASRCLRVLCTREFQVSIEDSVHKLLGDQIETLGLSSFYEVQKNTITGRNGSVFIFKGLRDNVSKHKSMEGIDIVWCEEAETISKGSWETLIPTIRKPGSEIWITFNPREPTDPTWVRFGPEEKDEAGKVVRGPPPGSVVVEMSWRDNAWLPAELVAEKDYLYRIDPEAAAHVWDGKFRRKSKASVLRGRWRVERFEIDSTWLGPYQGADWGFANDPTALVRLYVRPPVLDGPKIVRGAGLFVRHEAWGIGVDLDFTPELFDRVPDARKYVTRADSARPETISHMQRHGYPRVQAAEKGPGSVEDGVTHLQGYEEIVIHPDCPHTAEEARLWAFKTDKLTGDVLPDLIDKHNHTWDAARYALEPLMKQSGKGLLDFYKAMAAAALAAKQAQAK
jgi:phage terminase large subunit